MSMNLVIKAMLPWIEDNITRNITLKDLEARSGYTRWHFQRVFQQSTGIAVGEYIRKRRLTLAASDLKKSNKSITSIAMSYNFSSIQSFSRMFKKNFDLSPRQYRERQQIYFGTHMAAINNNQKDFIYRGNSFQEYQVSVIASEENVVMDKYGRYLPAKISRLRNEVKKADSHECIWAIEHNHVAPERRGLLYFHPVGELTHGEINRSKRREMTSEDIASGKYIVFKCYVKEDDLYKITGFIYMQHMPGLSVKRRAGYDIQRVKRCKPDGHLLRVEYMVPVF